MKKLALVLFVLVLLAMTASAWKWKTNGGHRSAGWTWDSGASQFQLEQ